jgi:hypothetical protein
MVRRRGARFARYPPEWGVIEVTPAGAFDQAPSEAARVALGAESAVTTIVSATMS